MLSVVIPVYNEEPLLDELVSRTLASLNSFIKDYEVIFVDDGSTDKTLEKLLKFREEHGRIRIISLSRNFGHQAAYTAGLEHAAGDIVAMMDGDLQDPPEILAGMYRMIREEGYNVINAIKTGRKGHKRKNLLTWIFHLIFRRISGISDIGNAGNFSMMTRDAVDALLSIKEKIRYLPGMRAYIGFRQGYIEFIRDDRFEGGSKMSTRRLFTLALNAIFAFSRFPILFCLWIGLAGIIIFLSAGIYLLLAKAFHFAAPGWSVTLLSLYFLGSIQLIFLGITGEYLYRNYKESQNRPSYFVNKIYNSTSKAE